MYFRCSFCSIGVVLVTCLYWINNWKAWYSYLWWRLKKKKGTIKKLWALFITSGADVCGVFRTEVDAKHGWMTSANTNIIWMAITKLTASLFQGENGWCWLHLSGWWTRKFIGGFRHYTKQHVMLLKNKIISSIFNLKPSVMHWKKGFTNYVWLKSEEFIHMSIACWPCK